MTDEKKKSEESKRQKVFISYSRKDSEDFQIKKIKDFLEDQDYAIEKVYLDIDNIGGGELFERKILDLIEDSNVVLFFCSKNAANSVSIGEEIGLAFARNARRIPVFKDEDDIPSSLKPYNGVIYDESEDMPFDEVCTQIFKSITGNKPEPTDDEFKEYFEKLKEGEDISISEVSNTYPLEVFFKKLDRLNREEGKTLGISLENLYLTAKSNKESQEDDIWVDNEDISTEEEEITESDEEKLEKYSEVPKDYFCEYVKVGQARTFLIDQGIDVHPKAKDMFKYWLDAVVERYIKELIKNLPRKSRGDDKGALKRKTFYNRDFKGIDAPDGSFKAQYIKTSKIGGLLWDIHDEGTKIWVAGDAKDYLYKSIDVEIEQKLQYLVNEVKDRNLKQVMPRVFEISE